jgi:hypothetical protein
VDFISMTAGKEGPNGGNDFDKEEVLYRGGRPYRRGDRKQQNLTRCDGCKGGAETIRIQNGHSQARRIARWKTKRGGYLGHKRHVPWSNHPCHGG